MKTQRGMSMIEIMVGVLIGLIGCVVIFQMYSVAEARKRSVSSGSDMDIAGRLGMMTLERDLQQAGYGFGMAASATATLGGTALGCNVAAYDSQRPTSDFTFPLAPVVITDGAAGAPDGIAVLQGSSTLLSVPKIVNNGSATATRVKADTGGRAGIGKGDRVIAVYRDAAGTTHDCAMFEITDDTNSDQLTYNHGAGASYTYPDPLNPGQTRSATARHNKGSGFTLGGEGRLYSLGPLASRNVWTVANGRLLVANDLFWTDADGDAQNDRREATDSVVNLQAQYGIDTTVPPDGVVDTWQNAAPADWTVVLAVRFALLTRSQQFERQKITTVVPRWSGSGDGSSPPNEAPFVMTNLDGTADSDPANDPNNWRYYRYNVFEAVVPLRNTIIGRQL
jgi:type IV pilus assembly protein PilW